MRNDPLQTIRKLIRKRYLGAKTVFWAGSVSKNQGTSASDLDLIIVYENLPNAYREAFIYDEWPVDAFVHSFDTLHYFFKESQTVSGIPGLINMILNAYEVTMPTDFSDSIKALAEEIFMVGPDKWDKTQIDKERFLITDALEDIKCPKSREEQIASAAWLYEALAQFYFRSQNKWRASGKSIVRYLKDENSEFSLEFTNSFDNFFQRGDVVDLEKLTQKVLTPFGGLLWDGYKSEAPKEFRSPRISL